MTGQAPTTAHAAQSLKKLATLGEAGLLALGAAVMAAVSSAFGARNVGFLLVTVAVMTLDLLAGVARAYLDPGTPPYDPPRMWGGIVGKLLRLTLVVVAALLDRTLILLLPRAADALAGVMPTTRGTFVWLIVAEASSVIAHVRASQGDAVIPAVLTRAIDRLRLGKEPPKRHSDKEIP